MNRGAREHNDQGGDQKIVCQEPKKGSSRSIVGGEKPPVFYQCDRRERKGRSDGENHLVKEKRRAVMKSA